VYRVLVGKSEVKNLHQTPKRRWEYNIKMELRGIRWRDVNWLDAVTDRKKEWAVVNTVMKRLFLYNARNISTIRVTLTHKEIQCYMDIFALRYKPAGSGFDSRWCHWYFSVG